MQSFDKSGFITKEMTDMLIEMDNTQTVTAQIEVSRLLTTLYNRLVNSDEIILIEEIGQRPAMSTDIIVWAESNLSTGSVKLFKDNIGK